MRITQCFAHHRIDAELSRLNFFTTGAMCFTHI